MKKKKFLNGTGLGSKSEPATRRSSAPDGTATGFVELENDALASVSGGTRLEFVAYNGGAVVQLYMPDDTGGVKFWYGFGFRTFADADRAADVLFGFEGRDVSIDQLRSALEKAGLTPSSG